MPTDEMLIERFREIDALAQMGDGDVETAYNLNPGVQNVGSFREATIRAICRISMTELQSGIDEREARKAQKAGEPSR